jgi:hypothetical protein
MNTLKTKAASAKKEYAAAANAFKHTTSATNFVWLQRAALAHQAAQNDLANARAVLYAAQPKN